MEKGPEVMTNRVYGSEANLVSFGRGGRVETGFQPHRQTKEQSYRSRCCRAFLHCVLALPAFLGIAGCSANATKTEGTLTPTISVAIVQAPPSSLIVGTSAPVSATVSNDPANAGVDWVAICGSAPNCGSFSPSHTASGAATTFTTPFGVPAHSTVTVTALSATDHSKTSGAPVTVVSTVTGITITQPPPSVFPSGGTLVLAATVNGDPANLGVDWKATCGTIDCTSGFVGTHSMAGSPISFVVPLTSVQYPTIVGSTVTITAFATADHSFSASASLVVTAPISISITQAPPSTVLTNTAVPLTAVVTDDPTNSGVTWTIESCDLAPCGSWSATSTVLSTQAASGAPVTYNAPPTPVNHVFIQAAATAAPQSAIATVELSVTAPISVAITQKIVNDIIVANDSAPLVATVSSDPANAGVDWTVTCGSAGACGTFSLAHTASGAATTFTAPATVPAGGGTVTITATSTTDPTKSATQTVTVTASVPPNSLLTGQFVFLLSAKNSSNGPYALGGVISGDGAGNITAGTFDLTDASGNASADVHSISPSTYSIGQDGRGQIHLLINTGTLTGNFGVNGAITLTVVFVTPQHALLSETDTFGTGTGTLDRQSLQSYSGLSGVYSLQLSGSKANANYFLASAVTIPPGSPYAYVTDQSAGGVITSVPFTTDSQSLGITGPDPNGKLLTSSSGVNLGPAQFHLNLWVIDGTHFVVTAWRDNPLIVAGYLTAQPSSPSISGAYAFTEAGATTAALPLVAGGIFTCGSAGILDVVPLTGAGTPLPSQPITASCGAPANGRGLITISGAASTGISTFAAYPTSDQGLYLIELDGGVSGTSGPSGAGVARQQTVATPISAAALNGKYASNFLASTALGSQNFAAQVISDGISILSGAADLNSFNTTAAPPAGTPSSGATLSGSFTADPSGNGRFPLVLTFTPAAGQPAPQVPTINPACYIVDANTCLLLGLAATAPGTGILQLQKTGL